MQVRIVTVVLGAASLLGILSAQTIKKVPLKPTAPNSGTEMFANYCAVCHGPDGKGAGPAASALNVPPANLTQLATRNHGKFPEEKVAGVLSGSVDVTAHGSQEMPIWGELFKSLGQNDPGTLRMRIANLTAYVKSIQAQ